MSLSKSKWWYSNNCLHFSKRAVPLLGPFYRVFFHVLYNGQFFQKLVKPVLLKALENGARQPSQVAIVTEAVHAAACLIRMASAEEAGTAGRAEKTTELAKLLNVESGAEKQARLNQFHSQTRSR
jgi:hypothetical protein